MEVEAGQPAGGDHQQDEANPPQQGQPPGFAPQPPIDAVAQQQGQGVAQIAQHPQQKIREPCPVTPGRVGYHLAPGTAGGVETGVRRGIAEQGREQEQGQPAVDDKPPLPQQPPGEPPLLHAESWEISHQCFSVR